MLRITVDSVSLLRCHSLRPLCELALPRLGGCPGGGARPSPSLGPWSARGGRGGTGAPAGAHWDIPPRPATRRVRPPGTAGTMCPRLRQGCRHSLPPSLPPSYMHSCMHSLAFSSTDPPTAVGGRRFLLLKTKKHKELSTTKRSAPAYACKVGQPTLRQEQRTCSAEGTGPDVVFQRPIPTVGMLTLGSSAWCRVGTCWG